MTDDHGNYVTLEKYIERIFEEKEKQLNGRIAEFDRRFEILNNLREERNRDRLIFVTSDTHAGLVKDVRALEQLFTGVLPKFVSLDTHAGLVKDVKAIETWQNRVIGMGIIIALGSGIMGAIVSKFFFH